MRLRLLLVALYLLLLTPASAAPMPGQVVIGPNDVLRGRITQEHHSHKPGNVPITTAGHFSIAPTRGLIWAIEQPIPTATVLTRDGMVQSFNGVPVMHVPAASVPKLLHVYELLGAALAGNWQPLESDFTVARGAAPGSNGGKDWQVVLTPRDPAASGVPFQTITVTGSQFVETALLLKANGDYEKLTFTGPYVAPSLSADEAAAFGSVRR